VTHHGITETDIDRALVAVREALSETRPSLTAATA
jgi:hypothetical protein